MKFLVQDRTHFTRTRHQLDSLQAPFTFSMTAPASQTVLFNTRLMSRTPLTDGLALFNFEPTPPISTYLVAFVVGSLTNVSALVPGNTPFDKPRTVSIWGHPHRCEDLLSSVWSFLRDKGHMSATAPAGHSDVWYMLCDASQ